MQKRMVAFAALAAALAAVWVGPAMAEMTPAQKQADIDALVGEWLMRERSLDADERPAFDAVLAELQAGVENSTDAEHALLVQRLLATTGNAHTGAYFGPLESAIHRLPIRVWWFEDGLYITKAHPDFAHLLGARIEAFGDLTAEQTLEGAATFIAGNAQWKRYRSIMPLTYLEALHMIGASASETSVDLGLVFPDGHREVVTLEAEPSPDPDADLPTWATSLAPNGGGWAHLLAADDSLPAFLSNPGENIYRALPDRDAAYIRFNRILGGERTLAEETAAFMDALRDEHPRTVVVDFRYNHGGDLTQHRTFVEGLYDLVPEDGHVYLLGGRSTLSAAIVALVTLYADGGDRVTYLGEPLGDDLRFWSEGGSMDLPGSGMIALYTDGYHDWADGCTPEKNCYWAAERYTRAVGDLVPDVPVPMSFDVYAAGRDQVMERVWELEGARRAGR